MAHNQPVRVMEYFVVSLIQNYLLLEVCLCNQYTLIFLQYLFVVMP